MLGRELHAPGHPPRSAGRAPWNEAGASWGWSLPDDEWLNKGGDLDPAPLAGAYLLDPLHSGEDGTKTVELDVTALVQAWQGGRIPNYGLALLNVDNDSKTTARPFSREADEDAKRPKLILYWAQPPQPDPNAVKPNALKPHGVPVQMRVQFSTPTLNQAHVGQEYKARLFAKGGLAPYTFKANSGLPDGVELTESGELQGKPAKPGRYTISVRIADAQRLSGSGQVELVVAEARPAKVDPLAAGEGKTAPPAAKTGEKTEVVEEE
ncbi:MAG: DNRLRE domain-containing protein [Planctomycetota bacterium]|nr:DNRLRE domain-containing protein [Planctomycetota bacterium]